MPRVTRRPPAEADILEIWDYIADDSVARVAADLLPIRVFGAADQGVGDVVAS